MNAREERGLIIAALCKLNQTPNGWLVPSQSGEGIYTVDPAKQTCTCPDHENGHKCKHLYAVEITMKREVAADGTVTETRSITFTEKKTYKQDWPAYNVAQATEKPRLQTLLHDLCKNLPDPERPANKSGPKPHRTCDAIFAMAFKVYSGFSSRRFSADLADAHAAGHTTRPISGMKVNQFLENEAYTPILTDLVAQSAAPLATVETSFAVDSSGFSTSKFERWFDHKYGITRQRCVWVKVHCAVGTKTNVVAAVRILDKDAGDAPQFKPLLEKTQEEFTIGEVSADKAYASLENFDAVEASGGQAFIAFKKNATGGCGGTFAKAFHYFQFKQDEYMAHYHKRSNVESTFSAVKRKFGDSVRSRCDVAMVNEVLCKLLCHNLCCLIQEQEELGIAPVFWKD